MSSLKEKVEICSNLSSTLYTKANSQLLLHLYSSETSGKTHLILGHQCFLQTANTC